MSVARFIDQLKLADIMSVEKTKYNSGYVSKHNDEFIITGNQVGAEDIFSVGQPVYDMDDHLMGYLGIGLYNALNYSTSDLKDVKIKLPDIPVEYWKICNPTEYCKHGKPIKLWWQKVVAESKSKSYSKEYMYTYVTEFNLDADVTDFVAAKEYLAEEDMVQYYKGSSKVKSIQWILKTTNSGIIKVESSEKLSNEELSGISNWINGQCSDGLGECFEQQDFASYCLSKDGNYDDDWVQASFDWEKNKYPLRLVEESVIENFNRRYNNENN